MAKRVAFYFVLAGLVLLCVPAFASESCKSPFEPAQRVTNAAFARLLAESEDKPIHIGQRPGRSSSAGSLDVDDTHGNFRTSNIEARFTTAEFERHEGSRILRGRPAQEPEALELHVDYWTASGNRISLRLEFDSMREKGSGRRKSRYVSYSAKVQIAPGQVGRVNATGVLMWDAAYSRWRLIGFEIKAKAD